MESDMGEKIKDDNIIHLLSEKVIMNDIKNVEEKIENREFVGFYFTCEDKYINQNKKSD